MRRVTTDSGCVRELAMGVFLLCTGCMECALVCPDAAIPNTVHEIHDLLLRVADEVILDMEVAGARNVFMRIGKGRIHLYDQSPRFSGKVYHGAGP